MHQLARMTPILTKRIIFGSAAVAVLSSQFFFTGGWFGRKSIYPPSPENITTNNRLFPNYISREGELHDLLLHKQPLIMNFTYQADPRCNKLTQALYDILANKDQYPSSKPVNMVSIGCDNEDGRNLMMTYGVNEVPSLVALNKQLFYDRFLWHGDEVDKGQLTDWIKKVAELK